MAPGSPSSSVMFFGTTGTADYMELMANSQQNHQLVDPNKQYPNEEVAIAVSANTLLDANRYVCEVCFKGFPRKQNLTLHRRAHNLPFTLKTRTSNEPSPRKVYLCPEPTCAHHNRSHALGDFGGLRKHYLRKHCTAKNYKCDTCCKAYNVEADLRAHSKVCAKKKYACHCGCRFNRRCDFTLHQAECDAPEHVGPTKCPQTLTRNDNSSSSRIGSVMSHPTTFSMGDNSIRFNSNENNYNLIGPHISSNQNQPNSYHSIVSHQYQLSQIGEDHSSLMTNASGGLNFSRSHPYQHEYQMKTDIGLYADLLMDKIPLHSLNLEDAGVIGDDGTSYRSGEGSNSFSNGSYMFDPSLTPAMRNTGQNGMLNPVSGISDGGSYGHASCYGYDYSYGSGQSGYGGAMEGCDFDASAATARAVAPSEPQLNQHGFWF
ncbi:putative transcription factor C2H2 family [Helianthus annuus]|nr:putative transcription factor C2H2 family [Helianthus annuus]